MNEELKIIIRAVTEQAKKEISEVKSKLGELETQGGKTSKSFGAAMSGLGKAAGIAAAAAIAAFTAIATALVALGKNTREYREEQARLNAAFAAAGSTAAQASETYFNLFRFMGDSDTASEAAAHLAKLTTNEKELAEWTTALQGVYATFGKSLPIESLAEAANESAKVGKVTGTLADALNWAGISEDAFNASLANCNSEQERQALILGTLNTHYKDAAFLLEKTNAEIIAQNEAQARLSATTGRLGKAVQPLLTALTNLSNVILTALEPAIRVVANAMTWLINIFSKAIGYVSAFISALTGKKAVENATQMASGIANVANSAGKLESNLAGATSAAEKLKRTTAGFDELNIIASDTQTGGGSLPSGGAGGAGLTDTIGGGFTLDTGFTDALDLTTGKINGFVETAKTKLQELFKKLKEVFNPSIISWGDAWEKVKGAVVGSIPHFTNGLQSLWDGFSGVGSYIVNTFVPDVTNSFSTSLAPVFGDGFSTLIEEAGLDFEFYGDLIDRVCADIITPALESVKTVTTDTFEGIGKSWDEHGKPFTEEYQEATKGIRDSTNTLYEKFLKPIWESFQKTMDETWEEHLKPLWDKLTMAFGQISTDLLILWNDVFKPVLDWVAEKLYPKLVKAFDNIGSKIKDVIGAVSKIIGGLIDVLAGTIHFITGIFTGDWRKAWDGIKQIFSGIWQTLVGAVQIPVNKIINLLNKMLSGITSAFNSVINKINSISVNVPDWVPKYGGETFGFNLKTFSAPQIPQLATGGFVVGETMARMGERNKKEVVLPLEQNTEWADILAAKLRQNTPTKIVLMVDKQQLGWASINGINGITEQTGNLQLKLV